MMSERFDRLARAVSRRALTGWLGSSLAAAVARLPAPIAAAPDKCTPRQRRCGGKCRRIKTDRRHCGRCNHRCRPGARCLNGRCRIPGGAVRRPFPQQLGYGATRVSRAQADLNNDVRAFYNRWKADFVVPVGNHQYRIAFGRSGDAHQNTVSEGQGYGMIIVATMAGYDPQARAIFDGLWRFVADHPSENDSRLMDWNINLPTGNASAFDGDADIAYGLLLADAQWGSAGAVNYRAAFNGVIAGVESSTIGPNSRLPELGDWVQPNGPRFNQYTPRSSDFMPGHFRAFARATGRNLWNEVITACSQVIDDIQANFSPNTGLLPDFIQPISIAAKTWRPADPNFLEPPDDDTYNYNAGRVPWRLGADALLNNDGTSATQAAKISAWAKAATNGAPTAFSPGYRLDGTPLHPDWAYSTFFVAPLGVAAMTASNQQAWLDAIYAAVWNKHEDYYEDSINLLCLLVMTGNFWQP